MAEVSAESEKKDGKKHSKKMSTRIDLTPMVDLGFLLITFFMLTTSLTKQKVMSIGMPVDGEPTPVANAMTVILGDDDKVYYYFGLELAQLEITNFSGNGIRAVLQDKNASVIERINALEQRFNHNEITETEFKKLAGELRAEKEAIMVLIKSDDKAKYKNLVDILDEMKITDVGKYAIVNMTPEEKEQINKL